jgi:surface antigen
MQSFEETKKLLENSNIYYLVAIDMNSNYSYLNSRYTKIFEPMHGSLVGKHYALTMHQDDRHICETVSVKAFTYPDQIFPAVIRKHDGKGGYVITQWEYKAMWNELGQPNGIFCIGHDITLHMHTSKELIHTKESLSKTKGTLEKMAYVQSHVIRKPIANIMGLALLLETMDVEKVDPNLGNIINMIHDNVKELDEVIRNMAGTQ